MDAPIPLRALILDRAHRCLLLSPPEEAPAQPLSGLPGLVIAPPARPLQVLTTHVLRTLGLSLGQPAGSLAAPAGPPQDYAFLVGEAPARWVPIGQATAQNDALWEIYVGALLGGYRPPRRDVDVFCFGDSPEMAARLAHLVVKGRKRVTSGWVAAAERAGETIPSPGLISVVTDGFGYPQCVIETVEVRRAPFAEVDAEVAAGEGEGDQTLADWREGHLAYFTREGQRLGMPFDDSAVIFSEFFRVLKVLG